MFFSKHLKVILDLLTEISIIKTYVNLLDNAQRMGKNKRIIGEKYMEIDPEASNQNTGNFSYVELFNKFVDNTQEFGQKIFLIF